jgi:aryl-alcohol dehydrogenase-like predicted oxidoreductase
MPQPTPTLKLAGTEVRRIGMGTNRLTNTPEQVAFVRDAVGAGLGHIDTAHLYTGGESEATIGAALARFGELAGERRSSPMLPIPGTRSLDHLKQNLAALELELDDDEFDALS